MMSTWWLICFVIIPGEINVFNIINNKHKLFESENIFLNEYQPFKINSTSHFSFFVILASWYRFDRIFNYLSCTWFFTSQSLFLMAKGCINFNLNFIFTIWNSFIAVPIVEFHARIFFYKMTQSSWVKL